MKAAVVSRPGGGFIVSDVDLDDPIGREVLIDVRASGLCHSDLTIAERGNGFPMPALLGHEVAGDVIGVGPAVTSVSVGDRVVVCMVAGCGICEQCRLGRPYRCTRTSALERGPDQDPRVTRGGEPLTQFMGVGGFAERVLVHENLAVPLHPDVPYDVACLLGCGVVTGAGAALNTARLRPGDEVAVIGCGGVGLNTIQGAALAGASRVIAVDLHPAKLELARAFGATDIVNASESDPVEAVRELTGGGVSHAFEVIGLLSTAQQAVQMLQVGGSAMLIGVQKQGSVLDLDLFGEIILPQRRIVGVAMGSTNPHIDIPMFAQLYLQGRFELDALVSERIALGDVDRAYKKLQQGAVARSVVTTF